MRFLISLLGSEFLKIRRSSILWLTMAFFGFVPVMIGIMVYLANNPEISVKLGLVGDKAALFRDLDWEGYLQVMSLIIAATGLVGFGFAVSWIFGREYSDRTIKDLLALPVPRYSIVISKSIVVSVWCLLLAVISFTTGSIMGWIISVPDFSMSVFRMGFARFIVTAFLTIIISMPVGFFASYGRGYMLPMGFVIITLIMSQFIGLVGLGPYFPWAIPGLYTGAAGEESVGIASCLILGLTGIAGIWGTAVWWRYADQK
jgi:ABC-2 type transport system permease protein